MRKLLLKPDRDGYSAQRSGEMISAKLDGGASKTRRDVLNAAFTVPVKWSCNQEQYNYLQAFYRHLSAAAHGSEPFLVDLYLDQAELVECEAKFVADSFKELESQSGLTWYVSATLEAVKPYDADESDDDEAILDAFEAAYPDGA